LGIHPFIPLCPKSETKKQMSAQEIFDNPFYSRTIGKDYQEINQVFNNRFPQVFKKLQSIFKI